MATITGASDEKIVTIDRWLGLCEMPDGDTKLKMGQASVLENWKITRDLNLQRRPGTRTICTLGDGKVAGLWHGNVKGIDTMLAACSGHMWKLTRNEETDSLAATDLGILNTDNRVNFFPFDDIVYMLNGHEYYQYDGSIFQPVKGYRPLVQISTTPLGAGTLYENTNKLTGERRVWFCPDGTSTVFQLPEPDLLTLDYVKNTSDGSYIDPSEYTFDRVAGQVTFTTAPVLGVDSIEIGYTAGSFYREDITKKTCFEFYSGSTDACVCLYGDGSNEFVFSGISMEDTNPHADYFPDLYEGAVGDKNTPITAMVRHHSSLVLFKTDSTWSVTFTTFDDGQGNSNFGYYIKPVNKSIGNAALGMVQSVLNNPRSLFGSDLYEWASTTQFSANITADERNAKRISDRIYSSLSGFDTSNLYTYDDNFTQQYFICDNASKTALIHNYACDAWYKYTDMDIVCMASVHSIDSAGTPRNEIYFGTSDGKIKCLSYRYKNDDGVAFHSVFHSGSMDLGKSWQRKYMNAIWVGIKPEANGNVMVTVETDRKPNYSEKQVDSNVAGFNDWNFSRFSFNTNNKPQTAKNKIKAKKFVFLTLILESEEPDTTATVLTVNMKVRITGEAK